MRLLSSSESGSAEFTKCRYWPRTPTIAGSMRVNVSRRRVLRKSERAEAPGKHEKWAIVAVLKRRRIRQGRRRDERRRSRLRQCRNWRWEDPDYNPEVSRKRTSGHAVKRPGGSAAISEIPPE